MGKGISKKEGLFHLKVCHIHCSLRCKKFLKKATYLESK